MDFTQAVSVEDITHSHISSQTVQLKEEQQALLAKQAQLEKIEEERKQAEERQKKFEMG